MRPRRPHGPIDFALTPFPGESLTSWYVRLARANATSLHELATKLLGRSMHSIATTDLDANANSAIPDGLARISGMPAEEARLMMLAGWQHCLSAEVYHAKRAVRWILPQRKDGSARRRGEWTQACLHCLATDPIPYFRLHWRFAFLTECVVHRVQMISACPRCAGPLDFPAMDRGHPRPARLWPLSKCPGCGVDWRIYMSWQRASDAGVWRLQGNLLRAIMQGWFVLAGDPVWTGLLLDGAYHLVRSLRAPKVAVRLAAIMPPEVGAPLSAWTPNRIPFEHLPLAERRVLMRYVSVALRAWPNSFVDLAQRCDLRMSLLHAGHTRPPYWLDRVVRERLDRTWFRQSGEEAKSAAEVLDRHGQSVKYWAVKEWLGFHVPKRRFQIRPADDGRQLRIWAIGSEVERQVRQALVAKIARILRNWCLRRARHSTARVLLPIPCQPHQVVMTFVASRERVRTG